MTSPIPSSPEPDSSSRGEAAPRTQGIDHLGLSVADLEETVRFFQEGLGWKLLGRKPEYPAAFVSDDHTALTLWQVEPDRRVDFDRRANVGLHHLALRVGSLAALEALHRRLSTWPQVRIEFAPQLSGSGPKTHFIAYEPGGLRVEFCFDPRRGAA